MGKKGVRPAVRRRFGRPWSLYVIFGLIALGILYKLGRNPQGILIPVLVLGGVFLLYKFPPHRWRSLIWNAETFFRKNARNDRKKRIRKAKFRVIPGSKPRDGDDAPKYH